MKRWIFSCAIAVGLILGSAGVADAVPGPGNSNQCAPGQQGNSDPGFKPGSCDNK